MKKKILSIAIAVMLLIVGLFLGARYSWRLFGFRYCIEPSAVYVESVEPGKGCYQVIGDSTDSASSFVGYTYKVEGDNIYIGLKYNTFLGFLTRDSSFNVKVDYETDGKKYNVYLVGNNDEKLIWPIEISAIEPLPIPILTKDMATGVAILSDYESDDKIIFHGYFGVFVYDLKAQEIILAIDLEKTLGTNQIQGSPCVNVVVNQDGSEMILYLEDTSEESEQMAYYINTLDGSYTYKKYQPFDKSAEYGDSQKYSGDTIESINYTSDTHTYKIFEGWKF